MRRYIAVKLIDVLKEIRSRWGFNKTVTILFLNLSAIGIVTCISTNLIPDAPDYNEVKEID